MYKKSDLNLFAIDSTLANSDHYNNYNDYYNNIIIIIIIIISIYTLSDLGVLINLIGSLSLDNEHYSSPTE